MDLELVSFSLCPFVHRVATLLHEKGAPFRIRYIDLKNKPDWFLAISPKGRVPVLIADGKPLFESAALLEFVDETQGARLLPDDPFERARQRAYISFAGDLFMAHYRLCTARGEADHEAALQAIRGQLATFEAALGEGGLFAGDRFGLVDAAVAPVLQRMAFLDERAGIDQIGQIGETGALDKVKAWSRRLAAHPSVQRGLPPDFNRLFLDMLRSTGGVVGQRLPAA